MTDRAVERRARVRPPRAETRHRVLEAAYAVFAERGIAAGTLADVADAARLTKGAIYSNFAGKDELLLALMEERVLQRVSVAVAGFGDAADVEGGLTAAGRVLAEATRADPAAHRLLIEYFVMSQRDPDRRDGLRHRRREARDLIARALTRSAEEAGLRLPLPPEQCAIVIMALSNGLAIESGIDPDAVPDDLFGRVLAFLARG